MMISTMNPGGRRITRAIRDTHDKAYGYRLVGTIPSLTVRLDGSDGKTYEVVLADGDMAAIAQARVRYAEHFERD